MNSPAGADPTPGLADNVTQLVAGHNHVPCDPTSAQNGLAHKPDQKGCRPIMTSGDTLAVDANSKTADPREPLGSLFRDLRTSASGLSGREAQRRLLVYGPNELPQRSGRRWPGELLKQVTHPLALVLVVAAVLAWVTGTPVLAAAIVAVIALNAGFAFVQELQAEKAVAARAAYLPTHAHVMRDAQKVEVEARTLVPGDVLVISQG